MLVFLESCFAARPFYTDDANIVGKKSCQLESWIEIHSIDDSAIWMLPSCNLFLNTELTLGTMLGIQTQAMQAQLKVLFVDTSKKGWGIGLAVGNTFEYTHRIQKSLNTLYLYVPATVELWQGRIAMHANIGYALRRLDSVWSLGLGMEVGLLRDALYAVGEVYYSSRDSLLSQAGLRTWLVRDILQMDATYGYDFFSRDHFFSLGIRLIVEGLF